MQTTTHPGPVSLGSARHNTRASGTGEQMELIPGRYWDETGVRADAVTLGSARASTRAVDEGDITELDPLLFFDVPGAALR